MLEILQFYVSGFWVWLGITIGIYVVGVFCSMSVAAICEAFQRRPSAKPSKDA